MTNERSARVPPTPFERWVQTEGLKVVTRHTIHNILTEPLEPWERTGCDGALLDLTHDHGGDRGMEDRGQIEYEDEDPRIRMLFEAECAKRGVKSEMPTA